MHMYMYTIHILLKGSPCYQSHQCVLKLLLVISTIHSVGPTLIQVPVVVHIGYTQALWREGERDNAE